jgi:hypothetical protein
MQGAVCVCGGGGGGGRGVHGCMPAAGAQGLGFERVHGPAGAQCAPRRRHGVIATACARARPHVSLPACPRSTGKGVMSLNDAVELLMPPLSDQEVIYYQSLLELMAGGLKRAWRVVWVSGTSCAGFTRSTTRRHTQPTRCSCTACTHRTLRADRHPGCAARAAGVPGARHAAAAAVAARGAGGGAAAGAAGGRQQPRRRRDRSSR